MRAWCVVVPRGRAEEVRRALRDRGLLLKHAEILREGDRILLPARERVDLGFPVEQRDVGATFVPVRSYKDVVRVPDRLRPLLPSSFDVIGDVAVLKIPEELEAHRAEIGRAILAWNPKVRVVARDRGVSGGLRIRDVEVVAGEPRTTTVHVEYGLRYHVDVARAYFSPRLGTERMRVARQVAPGEAVADPFAGVGPYAILIARRADPARVVAADANPEAVALLRRNVAANRADRVEVGEGDARDVLASVGPVDRVILDLPHRAMEFLPDALGALGPHGTVHMYGILEDAEREARALEVRYLVEGSGRTAEEVRLHDVRAYSPSQHHVAFDVRVGPG